MDIQNEKLKRQCYVDKYGRDILKCQFKHYPSGIQCNNYRQYGQELCFMHTGKVCLICNKRIKNKKSHTIQHN